jgi:3-hydroxyisobutyrate dehydrogenase/2-hydroxy-3-oxopropionate reductase
MSEQQQSGKKVGVVGTGKMGKPMAKNLIKSGYEVFVHNRSRPSVEELSGDGAHDAGSPKGIAAAADIIITSLPDPAAVQEVYLGDEGLVANARKGQLYVDTSTVDPETSRSIHAKLKEKGADFLDAPVSGGVGGAEAGTLTVMVGGDKDAFERALPVLNVLGQKSHLVGPSGAGTVIKLANQLLVGINMAGVAEALVLGVKAGADPNAMLEVLSTSFGSSRMLDRGIPMIAARDFGGGTPVDLLRKDLGLISDLANQMGVPLATGDTARAVFDRAHDEEYGAEDMTAIVRPMEKKAGVEVKGGM